MTPQEVILKYVGQKEGKGNVFDETTDLGKRLTAAGHVDGEAWCDLLQEVVHKEAYPERFDELDKLFTKSVVGTFKKMQRSGYAVGSKPAVGAIVFWQKYKDGMAEWKGHEGLVTKVNEDDTFESVEGNTNEAGSREGTMVMVKPHRMNWDTETGLRLIGFIKL